MTTPPQTPSELDKAVEEDIQYVFNRIENELNLSIYEGQQIEFAKDIRRILLAAKRLRTIEQASGTDLEHLTFSLQLLNRAEQAEKALVNSNDAAEKFEAMLKEVEKERDKNHQSIHKWSNKSVELAEQLSILRTEYKNAVVAFSRIASENGWNAVTLANEILSTPHAIAAMKKGDK